MITFKIIMHYTSVSILVYLFFIWLKNEIIYNILRLRHIDRNNSLENNQQIRLIVISILASVLINRII